MQHRIAVSHLKIGMYVVDMDCSWLSSPFWRSRFLVEREADIARIREAGVKTVTIDDRRGLGPVSEQVVPEAAAPFVLPEIPEPIVVERRPRRRSTLADAAEARARETVENAKIAVVRVFGDVRMGAAVRVEEIASVVDAVTQSIVRDRCAIINVTRLKTKNEYTYLHSVAVCALMVNFARQLRLPDDEVREAGLAGLLHDIGKMTTPEAVLDKPGKLDAAERQVMESHPVAGHTLLRESGEASAMTLDVCLHHHERIDGRGYPEGLTGEQLSLHARMSAICDVYDALTSHRPYKEPWSPSRALSRMQSWAGHFDERLLRTFIAGLGIHPVGALVRLHSNRLGIVLDGDGEETRLAPPMVRAFYRVEPRGYVAIEDVETGDGADPIIAAERGDRWFGEEWETVSDAVLAGQLPFAAAPAPARRPAAVR